MLKRASFLCLGVLALYGCSGTEGGEQVSAGSSPAISECNPTAIYLNQAGYLPGAIKIGVVVCAGEGTAVTFYVRDRAGHGLGLPSNSSSTPVFDPASGDYVAKVDFSSIVTPGNYTLEVGTLKTPFSVTTAPLQGMAKAAMKYFYYNRTMAIEEQYLTDIVPGDDGRTPAHSWASYHARVASRPNSEDASGNGTVPAFLDWTSHKFRAKNYHWDAGDNAIYPVNTATFDGLLMNMLEHYQNSLEKFDLNVPESGNGIPDLLNEIAYDADTMASMLPDPGDDVNIYYARGTTPVRLASHKIGMWNGYPFVKSAFDAYGGYSPNRDRYCNYVPNCDPSGSCMKPTNAPDLINSQSGAQAEPAFNNFTEPINGCLCDPVEAWNNNVEPCSHWGLSCAEDFWPTDGWKCEEVNPIYASKPSTPATYAVARYLAQVARLLAQYEGRTTRVTNYWAKAKDAYAQASRLGRRLWVNNAADRKGAAEASNSMDKTTNQNFDLGNLDHYYLMSKPEDQQYYKDYDGDGVYQKKADDLSLSGYYDDPSASWIDTDDINTPRGSGPYDKVGTLDDDKYAAVVEMYRTAHALGDRNEADYQNDVTSNPYFDQTTSPFSRFDWYNVAGFGSLSLLNDPVDVSNGEIQTALLEYADFIEKSLSTQGYPTSVPTTPEFGWSDSLGAGTNGEDNTLKADGTTDGMPEYTWGSNRDQVYAGVVLVRAYEITGNRDYLRAAHRAFDYLLGTNPLGRSYITGYGTQPAKYVHHRAALYVVGNYPGAPQPPGWLIGGPMSQPMACGLKDGWTNPTTGAKKPNYDSETQTPRFNPLDTNNPVPYPVAGVTAPYKLKAIAPDTAAGATGGWCSLEVTGDWNAGLAYLAYALGEQHKDVLANSDGTPDVVFNLTASVVDGKVVLTWSPAFLATSYIVLRSDTPGGPYTTNVARGVTGNTVTDSTVTAGTYYYVVVANNTVGSSEQSAPVSVTVDPAVDSSSSGLLDPTGGDTKKTGCGCSGGNASDFAPLALAAFAILRRRRKTASGLL